MHSKEIASTYQWNAFYSNACNAVTLNVASNDPVSSNRCTQMIEFGES